MMHRGDIVSRVASPSDSTRAIFCRSRPDSPELPLIWSGSYDSLVEAPVSFSVLGHPSLRKDGGWVGHSFIYDVDENHGSEYNQTSFLDCDVSLRTSMFDQNSPLTEEHSESLSEEYPYSLLLDYGIERLSCPFGAQALSESDIIIPSQLESPLNNGIDSRIQSLIRDLEADRASTFMRYNSLNRRSQRSDSNIQSTSMPSIYSQESATPSQHLFRNTIVSHQSTEETFTSRIPNSQSSFATMCVGVALDANDGDESDNDTIGIIETSLENDSLVHSQEEGNISHSLPKKPSDGASWPGFNRILGKKKQTIGESSRSQTVPQDEVVGHVESNTVGPDNPTYSISKCDEVDQLTQEDKKRRAINDNTPSQSLSRHKQAVLRKNPPSPPAGPVLSTSILGTILASNSTRKSNSNSPSPQKASTRPVISRPYALQKKQVPFT